jgi:hypothetical protein
VFPLQIQFLFHSSLPLFFFSRHVPQNSPRDTKQPMSNNNTAYVNQTANRSAGALKQRAKERLKKLHVQSKLKRKASRASKPLTSRRERTTMLSLVPSSANIFSQGPRGISHHVTL